MSNGCRKAIEQLRVHTVEQLSNGSVFMVHRGVLAMGVGRHPCGYVVPVWVRCTRVGTPWLKCFDSSRICMLYRYNPRLPCSPHVRNIQIMCFRVMCPHGRAVPVWVRGVHVGMSVVRYMIELIHVTYTADRFDFL